MLYVKAVDQVENEKLLDIFYCQNQATNGSEKSMQKYTAALQGKKQQAEAENSAEDLAAFAERLKRKLKNGNGR